MGSSLEEFCTLVADVGAKYAQENKSRFVRIVKEATAASVSERQAETIFKIFSFLNWAFANGVWSNLGNTALRRDLMSQSLNCVVLRTAYELATEKSNAGVAYLAAGLDSEFRQYAVTYNQRMKELAGAGVEFNNKPATLCGLEWIQQCLGLHDQDMNVVVIPFLSQFDVARIEELASQTIRASNDRKRGFFSRFFGS